MFVSRRKVLCSILLSVVLLGCLYQVNVSHLHYNSGSVSYSTGNPTTAAVVSGLPRVLIWRWATLHHLPAVDNGTSHPSASYHSSFSTKALSEDMFTVKNSANSIKEHNDVSVPFEQDEKLYSEEELFLLSHHHIITDEDNLINEHYSNRKRNASGNGRIMYSEVRSERPNTPELKRITNSVIRNRSNMNIVDPKLHRSSEYSFLNVQRDKLPAIVSRKMNLLTDDDYSGYDRHYKDKQIPPVTSKTHYSLNPIPRANIKNGTVEEEGTPHLPDVLIIGAKKAGTRALLEFSRLHPLVRAAKQELHFFDRHYHRGARWYKQKLPPRLPGQLTIEKTPAYLVSPQVPGRVRQMLPEAKLLMVVREPATRALSDYTQSISKHTNRKNFTQLVFADRSTGLVNVNWGPLTGGLYARHLQRWLRYFPPTSIHVVSGENLVINPAQEMQRVEKFLGLPPFITSKHFFFNKTKGFQCIMVEQLVATNESQVPVPPLQELSAVNSHHNSPHPSNTNISAPVYKSHCLGNTKGRDHPEVDPETFKILQEFYRPFNHKFFRMIGRIFNWNN